MGALAEALREQLPTDFFTDTEVSLLGGSANSRYGLVKRAIAAGDIVQMRRGVYSFGRRYRRQPLNLHELAQRIYTPSYVSLESALSYHGWIPEAAYTVTSICAKRSAQFETPVGIFSYERIPRFNFIGVDRMVEGTSIFLMACPTKALIDYVLTRKVDVPSAHGLAADLRIESESLGKISREVLAALVASYRSKRVARFARALTRELRL